MVLPPQGFVAVVTIPTPLEVEIVAVGTKLLAFVTSSPSTTRKTAITPTAGKRIVVDNITGSSSSASKHLIEFYFGTAATILTTPTKGIAVGSAKSPASTAVSVVWVNGKEPKGAIDEVVSVRTDTNIGVDDVFVFTYHEE